MILPKSNNKVIQPSNTTKPTYLCKWCRHTFVREHSYMEHVCKQMKRAEEFQTPLGQTAWRYYEYWIRTKKRQPPPPQSFLDSKLYMTFINFVKFCNTVNLPQPEKFIRLMVSKDYQPTLWMASFTYVDYLEYLDRQVEPLEQAITSVNTILTLSEKLNIDSSKVFDELDTFELIDLIQSRRLSPWLLLFSDAFSRHYQHKASPEQRVLIESLIRPEYWAGQFDIYASEIEKIKKYIEAVEL